MKKKIRYRHKELDEYIFNRIKTEIQPFVLDKRTGDRILATVQISKIVEEIIDEKVEQEVDTEIEKVIKNVTKKELVDLICEKMKYNKFVEKKMLIDTKKDIVKNYIKDKEIIFPNIANKDAKRDKFRRIFGEIDLSLYLDREPIERLYNYYYDTNWKKYFFH